MEDNFILRGDICWSTGPDTMETVRNGWIVCEEGKCAGVFTRLPEQYKGLPVTDTGGQLIVPGLTDLHLHAPQYTFRGMGTDLELLDWLENHTFPEEERYEDMSYASKAYDIFAQDLKNSPTTRACVFATVHREATEYLMEALEQTGLCTYVGKVNMDRNAPKALCEGGAAASAKETRRWLEDIRGRFSHTCPILTPRFVPACSDELMGELAKIREEWNLPVQSHLSENQSEVEWVKELMPEAEFYGDAYDRFGLFGGAGPAIMAHCVWSDDREMGRMKDRGVHIAHCPQSNMNLSSGIAPVKKYLSSGLRLGLGSDMAGGYHLSIFRAMLEAVQVSKLRWRLVDQDLAPLTLKEAFYIGTKGGGSFFGKVGSFEKGYAFDAVVMDDRGIRTARDLSVKARVERMICMSEQCTMTAKYAEGRRIC